VFETMNGSSRNAYPSPLTEVRFQTQQGEFAVTIPGNEIFRIENIFQQHEYHIPSRFLPTSSPLVVVDIGANVGLFALYMKSIRPDCAIHCFEPVSDIFDLLKINTAPFKGIDIYPVGLGDKTAMVPMALHPENSGGNSIKFAPVQPSRKIEIPIVAANSAFMQIGLSYIDVLKIDTEGCEVDILLSLQPRLRHVGVIMFEYHNDKDRRCLDDLLRDFKLFDARVVSTEGGTLKYINAALL